jgi:hypothetical protein
MKLHPLLIAALVGGGLYYFSQRRKQGEAGSSSGNGTNGLPPGEGGGGPNGNGDPNLNADGFVLQTDCARMLVQDQLKTKNTLDAFYRSNVLNGGQFQFGAEARAADAHARAFFTHYWGTQAPNCLPKPPDEGGALATLNPMGVITGPYGDTYVMPVAAPLAQQILYAFVFSAMTSFLLQDNRWTLPVAQDQMARVVGMLKDAKVTEADWNETFQGTVPMPDQLKPDGPGLKGKV